MKTRRGRIRHNNKFSANPLKFQVITKRKNR